MLTMGDLASPQYTQNIEDACPIKSESNISKQEGSSLFNFKNFITFFPKDSRYKQFRCEVKVLTVLLKLLENDGLDALLAWMPEASLKMPLDTLKLVKFVYKFFKGLSVTHSLVSNANKKDKVKKDKIKKEKNITDKKDQAKSLEKKALLNRVVAGSSDTRRTWSKTAYAITSLVTMPILFYATFSSMVSNNNNDEGLSENFVTAVCAATLVAKSLQDCRRLSVIQSAVEKSINAYYAGPNDTKIQIKGPKRRYFCTKASLLAGKEVAKACSNKLLQNCLKGASAVVSLNKPSISKDDKKKIKELKKAAATSEKTNKDQQKYLQMVRIMICVLMILNICRFASNEYNS